MIFLPRCADGVPESGPWSQLPPRCGDYASPVTSGRIAAGGRPSAGRVARAVAVAALTLPVILIAQQATGGPRPALLALVAAGLAVTLVALALPARTPGRLAAVVGLAQLAGHATLTLLAAPAVRGGCLPTVGRGAAIALRFRLVDRSAGCPPGTLVPGMAGRAALVCLLLAGGVLLCHTVAAAVAGLLVVAAEAAISGLSGLIALALPFRIAHPGWRPLVASRPALPIALVPLPHPRPGRDEPVLRRGPPRPAAAPATI